MRKKLFKYTFVLLCFMFLFIPLVYADDYEFEEYEEYTETISQDDEEEDIQESTTPSQISKYSAYDYVIDSYDVNIVVNEDNSYDITETIVVYFNVYKHGIVREIRLKNTVERLDGTTTKNTATVSNVSVLNNTYTTSKSSSVYSITIGDSNKTIKGEKKYVITYTYDIGNDKSSDYDELYFNIIGDEWDTVIGNVTFTIQMPKEFDASKLGFYAGSTGSTDSSNITYKVNAVTDKTITGSYSGILNPGEGLTVRLELEEGYFVSTSMGEGIIENILAPEFNESKIIIMSVIFAIISVLLWLIFGRDKKVVETVEFYPPDGFNSAELAFLYKGVATSSDINTLLFYLASKGYLKIEEVKADQIFGPSTSYKITKLKEYDGDKEIEQIFLEGLFARGDSVTLSSLSDRFYTTVTKISRKINSSKNISKIMKKFDGFKMIIYLFILVTLVSILGVPAYSYLGAETLPFAILFPLVGIFGFFGVVRSTKNMYILERIMVIFFITIWAGGFVGMPFIMFLLPAFIAYPTYLIPLFVGIASVIVMYICATNMDRRTPYGIEILGKILGFKRFLETVEKERLESLVLADPTYYYDILPYAYVLGVSDMWISKFGFLTYSESPDWYSASNFDIHSMNRAMRSAQNNLSSSPSSDGGSGGGGSSGGSSGGGSSGGGSGGGGGHSW